MDNLVLVRVAAALDASLAGAVLRDLREEAPGRIRLVLESDARPRTVVLSLRPERPWIGRPVLRARAERSAPPSPVVVLGRRTLLGAVVRSVSKPGADRVLRVAFAEGHTLVAELATHGANLLLLDAAQRVLASARRPRSSADRTAPGAEYRSPALPARVLVAQGLEAGAIDRYIEERVRAGEDELEVLRRHIFGIGTEGARLVVAESRLTGASIGTTLAERLAALDRGALDPVVEGPPDLLDRVRREGFDASRCRLLPWEPAPGVAVSGSCFRGDDAAATSGVFHEAQEAWLALGVRRAALRALLGRERERVAQAERRARSDQASFQDPERYRLWGEALLAGLGSARRSGGAVLVPDPYRPDEGWLSVSVSPEKSLPEAAGDCFRAHRRARRGLEQAARRVQETVSRGRRLVELEARFEHARAEGDLDRLEQAFRDDGIPVGLARQRARSSRELPSSARPRLEGVRVFRVSTGATLLAGKSARDSQRLTFRLAAPEDFWFHAADRRGAHVVLRNDERAARPSRRELEEAAAAAAFFSEGREDTLVDVHWTRRKYVRRARGAPAGTVLLKRFETVRVRPVAPRNDPAGAAADPDDAA